MKGSLNVQLGLLVLALIALVISLRFEVDKQSYYARANREIALRLLIRLERCEGTFPKKQLPIIIDYGDERSLQTSW